MRERQARQPSIRLPVTCHNRGCYVIKSFRPCADAIQHTHPLEPTTRPPPYPGVWDFLTAPDTGYSSE